MGDAGTVLLADIGGTHARIALLQNGEVSSADHYELRNYDDAAALFKPYAGQAARLLICAAGHLGADGIWRIDNHQNWAIDPDNLKRLGFTKTQFVHDFVALAQGALALDKGALITLREGTAKPDHQCVIAGAGTGLGLAIATKLADGRFKILRSHGGHNLAVTHTQEQKTVVNIVRRLQNTGDAVCFEDVASGRGLPYLYKAVSMVHGLDLNWPEKPDLKALAQTVTGTQTLRLFHEFLGYYLQGVCVNGHATGGVYLDGGVLQKLYAAGLLDTDTLFTAMTLCNNNTVRTMLQQIPVYLVNARNVAITGLAHIATQEDHI